MKSSLIALALLATVSPALAGTPYYDYPSTVAPSGSSGELFGRGFHAGGHLLRLFPDPADGDDVWGGGVNFDYFLNPHFGFQLAGAWADPTTTSLWHNYTVDLVLRLPIEAAHIAPYAFVGGGAIIEQNTNALGRAGVGLEFRPTSAFGIFADYIYNLPGGEGAGAIENYKMLRLGLKFGF